MPKSSFKLCPIATKLLHKSLPDLQLRDLLLVVPPVRHILRCFTFEPTFDDGSAYFWRVVMPLYRPPSFLIFNYSDRIPNGEKLDVVESELDRTVARLVELISRRELAYLEGIRGPKEFLQQIDWDVRPKSPNYRMDLALSQYMAGNVPACLETLEDLASAKVRPIWAETVRLAGEMARELKTDRSAMDKRLEAWEAKNMGLLGVTPRRTSRSRQQR